MITISNKKNNNNLGLTHSEELGVDLFVKRRLKKPSDVSIK